jgi:hypothetical protein
VIKTRIYPKTPVDDVGFIIIQDPDPIVLNKNYRPFSTSREDMLIPDGSPPCLMALSSRLKTTFKRIEMYFSPHETQSEAGSTGAWVGRHDWSCAL